MLKEKQAEMMREMMGESEKLQAEEATKEREKYNIRGIYLSDQKDTITTPYFSYMSADENKNNRFLLPMNEGEYCGPPFHHPSFLLI